MDWMRAKTLFIGLFLFLNVFLAGVLYLGSAGETRASYEAHADMILASRKIEYKGSWPTGPDETGMIRFESRSPDVQKLLERLLPDSQPVLTEEGMRQYRAGTRSLTLLNGNVEGHPKLLYQDTSAGYLFAANSADKLDKELTSFFKAIGLAEYRLELDRMEETPPGIRYEYIQRHNGGKLFDNHLSVLLREGGLAEIQIALQPAQQMIAPVGGGTGAVLSAQQVLLLSSMEGPLIVESMDFGWGQADPGELYYSPVWRLLLAGGQSLRLDAYTGQPIAN